MVSGVYRPAEASRAMKSLIGAFAVASAICAAAAYGQDDQTGFDPDVTRADVEAAYTLLRDHHPAGHPDLGDDAFRHRLEQARATALERAGQVTALAGHHAVLAGFAVSMHDPHIAAAPIGARPEMRWPGFLAGYDGGGFYVSASTVDALAGGERILSCDGRSTDQFAQGSIGTFNGVWAYRAQRAKQAVRLFIDQGNPFIDYPQRCTFARDGREFDVALSWRAAQGAAFRRAASQAQARGSRAPGLNALPDGGLWLRLPALDQGGFDLVEGAAAYQDRLRSAPYVIVDVRGNGGGNSQIGDRLADILGLPDLRLAPRASTAHWRVSADNLAQMRTYLDFGHLSDAFKDAMRDVIAEAEIALTTGQSFVPALPDGFAPAAEIAPPQPDPATARVFILTDHYCFSSCIMMVERFRRGGAAHIGGETDVSTRYMEIRGQVLPSQTVQLFTMQKVDLGSPPELGPHIPSIRFEGDWSDEAAVHAFAAEVIAARG